MEVVQLNLLSEKGLSDLVYQVCKDTFPVAFWANII